MSSFKRPRSQSLSSDSSASSSQALPVKSARIPAAYPSTTSQAPLLCTLPPTCSTQSPTPLAGPSELEAHYATHHAHVCKADDCGAVFPDARLLELHQTECHDPIAAVRKERGEKIFACHLPTCPRMFLTPKTRRLHLIAAHGFPRAYFFAVTNKGIGGLLKKWGAGASMIRGEWKDRPSRPPGTENDDGDTMIVNDEIDNDNDEGDVDHKAHVDELADSMTNLGLGSVPTSIRFGRGGKTVSGLAGSSGFPGRGGKGRGRGKGKQKAAHDDQMDTEHQHPESDDAHDYVRGIPPHLAVNAAGVDVDVDDERGHSGTRQRRQDRERTTTYSDRTDRSQSRDEVFREPESPGVTGQEQEAQTKTSSEDVFAFVPRNVQRARGRGRGRGRGNANAGADVQPMQAQQSVTTPTLKSQQFKDRSSVEPNSSNPYLSARGRGTTIPLRRGLALGPMRGRGGARGRGRGQGTSTGE